MGPRPQHAECMVLMKASFELVVPAGRPTRAASRRRSSLRLCAALEDREHRDSDERQERRGRPVDAPPAPGALPRLLDQRLDEGLELLAVDGIARARRARRGSDGHRADPHLSGRPGKPSVVPVAGRASGSAAAAVGVHDVDFARCRRARSRSRSSARRVTRVVARRVGEPPLLLPSAFMT